MKKNFHIVSLSGGKDSTAMLLRMLELDMQVDEIVFCDTGAEYEETYDHLEKVEAITERKITRLQNEHPLEYYLLEKNYRFPFRNCRWCTAIFKTKPMAKYIQKYKDQGYNVIEYIGIAADEAHRAKNKAYPLIEWGWTEENCLEYCKSKGFDFGGLYDHFTRISCWCCPMQTVESFRELRTYKPHLWQKLLSWEKQKGISLTKRNSAAYLDYRFRYEEKLTEQGKKIPHNNKHFQKMRREFDQLQINR